MPWPPRPEGAARPRQRRSREAYGDCGSRLEQGTPWTKPSRTSIEHPAARPLSTEPYVMKIDFVAPLETAGEKSSLGLKKRRGRNAITSTLQLLLAQEFANAETACGRRRRCTRNLAEDSPDTEVYRGLFRLYRGRWLACRRDLAARSACSTRSSTRPQSHDDTAVGSAPCNMPARWSGVQAKLAQTRANPGRGRLPANARKRLELLHRLFLGFARRSGIARTQKAHAFTASACSITTLRPS